MSSDSMHDGNIDRSRAARRVALITYSGKPALTADDQLLLDALSARGAEVDVRPWDGDAEWAHYDDIVLRSTWNFYLRPHAFLAWVDEIGGRHPGALLNAPPLVRWSVDKRYLEQLAARGVSIVPTVWVGAGANGDSPTLASLIDTQHWDSGAVVKPAISATAHETWHIAPGDAGAHEERFRRVLAASPSGIMVQPFIPEIRGGEWSLIFLGGEYSHAVVKRPALGDFRVQHDFGGTVERCEPSASLVADARVALHAAADATDTRVEDILYARVDGVDRAGRLMLMELELIEPVLFFAHAPFASERMAALILDRRQANHR